MTENNLAITEQAAKRVQADNPELKKPGNKDQYIYNTEVLRCIEKEGHSFNKGEANTGLENLNTGKTIIAKRQKLVPLVDREESGWNFMQEYTRDKLASDSDDEKQRSEKAEINGNKKAHKEQIFTAPSQGMGSNTEAIQQRPAVSERL